MFVSESNIVGSCSVRLNISSLEGTSVRMMVDLDVCVDALKIDAVSQLYDSAESCKLSLYYNLLHVRTGRLVNEELTLRQAQVEDNDEIILIRRRLPLPPVPPPKKDESIPTVDDIAKATAALPTSAVELQHAQTEVSSDFQSELPRIIVSLVDVAQRLVCLNSNDLDEAKKYTFSGTVKQTDYNPGCPVESGALQRLLEMGFDRAKATKALLVNRMSHVRAVQWLCDNINMDYTDTQNCSTPSTPVLSAEPPNPVPEQNSCTSSPHSESGGDVQTKMLELSKLPADVKVQQMMDAFRLYKRSVFRPDPVALQSLLEMGFNEPAVLDALRKHNNSKDEACDWLLNHDSSSTTPDHMSHDPVGTGLDPSDAVYKAITSNYSVRLSLSNHKTLIALLHILDSPNSLQQWIRDSDMHPLLVQISRLYHANRYTLD